MGGGFIEQLRHLAFYLFANLLGNEAVIDYQKKKYQPGWNGFFSGYSDNFPQTTPSDEKPLSVKTPSDEKPF